MEDDKLIADLLKRYFDGLYHSDVECLSSVFHPKAFYSNTSNGQLEQLSMPSYFERVRNRKSPASLKQVRQDKVLFVDLIGKTTALAKVQCVIEPKFFTDFLSLLKVEGQWQIISKVFHYKLLTN